MASFGATCQVDECAGALIRAASRAEEDLSPALPPRKRAYLFGCLGPAAARTLMWLLPEMPVRAACRSFDAPLKGCDLLAPDQLRHVLQHAQKCTLPGIICMQRHT
jgi:hypothetical protein